MPRRSGSFSQAAEVLYVTHGAVSRLVRQLEDDLGVPLFERHQDGVTLTPAGQRLRAASAAAFKLLDEGCEAVRRSGRDQTSGAGLPQQFYDPLVIPRLDRLEAAGPGTAPSAGVGWPLAGAFGRGGYCHCQW